MAEKKSAAAKADTEKKTDTASKPKAEATTTEAPAPKPKRKRNRPDLANFGQEGIEAGDNARYIRHAMAAFDLEPIDISDAEQVKARIKWYFEHCGENDMKPTVTGLCNALGVDKGTLWRWKEGEVRGATHCDLVKRTYAILEELWEDYMQNGKINPVSGIFLGKNHFGYQDKTDIVVSKGNKDDELPREALEAKYRDAIMAEGEATIESTAVDPSDY